MTDGLSRVRALIAQARERVMVVSAYLGANALAQLLDSVPKPVAQVRVFARWEVQDIVSGATDWRAWDVARARGVPLLACPGLHAKIYVADSKALVGSANATASGLGLGGTGNLELLVPASTSQPSVAQLLTLVEQRSREALPLGIDSTIGRDAAKPDTIPIWLPEVSPEDLLAAFSGRASHTAETLRTCTALRIPNENLREAQIRTAVQQTTSFRVVEREFDTRPLPMTVDQLRDLLVEKIDSQLATEPPDRISHLLQWLGHFGANTHLGESPEGRKPALHAGERIVSYELKDPSD